MSEEPKGPGPAVETWWPPTQPDPMPVVVLSQPPPAVDTWWPPTAHDPMPVVVVGGDGVTGGGIPEPPDSQLYGRRGPSGSGMWDLVSLAAGPPEAPITGGIYGRGQVAGVQSWSPVLPIAGGDLTGPLILAADPTNPLGAATKIYVDNVGAVANLAVKKSGDTMTGPLLLSGDPTAPLGAATKSYVDVIGGLGATAVQRAGDTMTGLLILNANPVANLGAATKQYVDAVGTTANGALQRSGGTMTGPLILAADPTAALGAVTKQYADAINTIAINAVRRTGDSMTGLLVLSADPTAPLGAVTKQYADNIMAMAEASVDIAGDTMTGPLILSGDPTVNLGAATKQYVDARAAAGGISDAPSNATYYGRYNATWQPVAPLASPALTGTPTAPTAIAGTNTTQIASTAFVATATGAYVPLAGATMTGNLFAPNFGARDSISIGGPPPLGGAVSMSINANTVAPPPPPGTATVSGISIAGADFTETELAMDAFSGVPVLWLRSANGTAAAPAAVSANQLLGAVRVVGRGATSYAVTTRGGLYVQAIENWTDTAQGTQLALQTTPAGTAAARVEAALGPGVVVGTPTAPSGGMRFGDINASRIMVDGVAVGGGISLPLAVTNGGTGTGGPFTNSYGDPGLVYANGTNPLASSAFWSLDVGVTGFVLQGTVASANPGDAANIKFSRARGTPSAPSTTQIGDNLGQIQTMGYGATDWSAISAIIRFEATEAFTNSANGGRIMLAATPAGARVPVDQAIFGPGLTVGTPTAPAGGMLVGDINAQRVMVNGVAVGTGGGGVNPGTANQLAYYAADGSAVDGASAIAQTPDTLGLQVTAAADDATTNPYLQFRRQRLTAPPSNNDLLGGINWDSYDGTAWTNGAASVRAFADGFWTAGSAYPTRLEISTVNAAEMNPHAEIRIGNGVRLGNTTATPGTGGINATKYLLNSAAMPLYYFYLTPISAGQNPDNLVMVFMNISHTYTIMSIDALIEIPNGSSATFDIYKSPANTALSGGTKLNKTTMDTNWTAGASYSLNIATGMNTLGYRERIGIRVVGGTFTNFVGAVTICLSW